MAVVMYSWSADLVDLALVEGEGGCAGWELFEEGADLTDLRLGGVLVDLPVADHPEELSCLAGQLEEGHCIYPALLAHRIDLGKAYFFEVIGDDGAEFVVGSAEFVIKRKELCDHLV